MFRMLAPQPPAGANHCRFMPRNTWRLHWLFLTGFFAVQAMAQQVETMTKIALTVDGKQVICMLEANASAKDFLSLLPMTLTLEDYHGIEKVSDLPRKLSTQGAGKGLDPSVGDITYYAPWGNLAIFYRDFGYASGLIKLGRIESGLEYLQKPGAYQVTIDQLDG